MKKLILLLHVALMMILVPGDASAFGRRSKVKEVHVQKQVPNEEEQEREGKSEREVQRERAKAERRTASVNAGRKQAGNAPSGTNPPKTGKKKVHIGRPVERELKKSSGSGRVFDVRALPRVRPQRREKPEREGPAFDPYIAGNDAETTPKVADSARLPLFTAAAPAPIGVFEGLNRELWGAGSPPDTVGDAGPDHYIQSVNSSVGIYDKTTGAEMAAFTFDTLMAQGNFGNQCDDQNFGDPVILYDTFEDRWILTDFAFTLDGLGNVSPAEAFQCFAVSMTGDPVSGGWNFYSIQFLDGLNDYPKLAIWPDGLYMSTNMFGFTSGAPFQGAKVLAINKAQMYAGSPTVQVVSIDAGDEDDFTIIPSNARLQTGTPPPGTPNYFVSTWNYLNAISVYKFHVDWTSIGLSTFTGPDVPLAATSWPNANVANIPQSGTAQLLDTLQIRAMMQNQYTNFAGVESLWNTHTVRRADATGFAAPRWYQANVTGGTVNAALPQAATWDPDASNVMHRFMPSLALDRAGNMALGYSTSSSTTFPSIKYAGRLAADAVNTFSQTEQTMFAGTASQTSSARWGDYSSMTLDPDGCTFWYTLQYANPDAGGQTFDKRWKTKFGSFKFAECTPVGEGGTVSGTVTATVGGAPIAGATVAMGARSATTSGSGTYSFTDLPAGTYPSITASAPGYTSSTTLSVVVTDGGTTTKDFSLAASAASACFLDTIETDFQTGVATNTSLTASTGNIVLANPDVADITITGYTTSGVGFTNASIAGQTFTPTVTGQLVKLDLNLFCSGCSGTDVPIIVEIHTTSSSNVSIATAALATATIPGFSSPSGGFMTATFSTPPTLTAGTLYGFIVKTATLRATGTQAILRSNSNTYANGRRQTCNTTSCANTTDTELVFIAYMNTGYAASGNFVSSAKDSNPAIGLVSTWTSIAWNATTSANTDVKFQAAGSNSVNGPFTFVGPDQTAATFFTSGSSLSQFDGMRYVQYKARLTTTDGAVTPTVGDVTICHANVPCTPGAQPAAFTTSSTTVCQGQASVTYTVPNDPTVTYNWSYSGTGATINGTGNSVTVDFSASATNGTLSVTATNSCGTGTARTISVTVNPLPTQPAAFTVSSANVCAGQSGVTYTVPNDPTVTYNWFYTGTGHTINGTGNSVTVDFSLSATSGTIFVTATNSCSTSAPRSIGVTVNPLPDATISTLPLYQPGASGTASVNEGIGLTYLWSVGNGTITGGQGTGTVSFTAGTVGTLTINVTVTTAAGCSDSDTATPGVAVFGKNYFTLIPCRVFDTRLPADAPALSPGVRTVTIAGKCGVPLSATAVLLNVTSATPSARGTLTLFSADLASVPGTFTLSFPPGLARAGNSMVTLSTTGAIKISTDVPSGTVPTVLDVFGYMQEGSLVD